MIEDLAREVWTLLSKQSEVKYVHRNDPDRVEVTTDAFFADSEPPTPFASMEDIAKRRFTGEE